VYERLTPREQKIADIETAKFIKEGQGPCQDNRMAREGGKRRLTG